MALSSLDRIAEFKLSNNQKRFVFVSISMVLSVLIVQIILPAIVSDDWIQQYISVDSQNQIQNISILIYSILFSILFFNWLILYLTKLFKNLNLLILNSYIASIVFFHLICFLYVIEANPELIDETSIIFLLKCIVLSPLRLAINTASIVYIELLWILCVYVSLFLFSSFTIRWRE